RKARREDLCLQTPDDRVLTWRPIATIIPADCPRPIDPKEERDEELRHRPRPGRLGRWSRTGESVPPATSSDRQGDREALRTGRGQCPVDRRASPGAAQFGQAR